MLRNYFTIALRNLMKNKTFSFINIFGLSVSMSVCLLIILIIVNQKRYDSFHADRDRIYGILTQTSTSNTYATAAYPLGTDLKAQSDGVEALATLQTGVGGDVIYGDKIISMTGFFANNDFFKVFSFELASGLRDSVLTAPYQIVFAEEAAKRMFGETDPVGKVIQFNHRGVNHLMKYAFGNEDVLYGDFLVVGVVKKNEVRSHIPFEVLISLPTYLSLEQQGIVKDSISTKWDAYYHTYHYLKLKPQVEKATIEATMNQLAAPHYAHQKKEDVPHYRLQPLADYTPGDLLNNMISFSIPKVAIYFLGVLALIVMFSACFNYTNLSVARALTRAREVGIRKVAGAHRGQIIGQFIAEAVIISLLSLALAVVLLEALKPAFGGLWLNQFLQLDLSGSLGVTAVFVVFALVTGLLAGLFPALYLSRFQPVQVLKNLSALQIKSGFLMKRVNLRKVLIVLQFTFSLIFITTAVVIYFQISHMTNAEYGYSRDNILNVRLQGMDARRFAEIAKQHPDVQMVSSIMFIPSTGFSSGTSLYLPGRKDTLSTFDQSVDRNFLEVFQIPLVAGTNFPAEMPEKEERFILINEKAAAKLGFAAAADAVGKTVQLDNGDKTVEIVGVVKDFHHQMLIQELDPLILRYQPEKFNFLNLRISGGQSKELVKYLEMKWKELDPIHPFHCEYLDEQLAETNALFVDVAKIVGFVAVLAVMISCLGLLGISSYATQTRLKEIGIRKVLGSTVNGLMFQLSKTFLWLLAFAALFGTPAAWFLNRTWLEQFAYRIDLSVGVLSIGIVLTFLLAISTVISQTWRAARINPVDTLRGE